MYKVYINFGAKNLTLNLWASSELLLVTLETNSHVVVFRYESFNNRYFLFFQEMDNKDLT